MPVRIYDISKKLGLDNKQVLAKAKALGLTAARVASSSLDKITAEYLELSRSSWSIRNSLAPPPLRHRLPLAPPAAAPPPVDQAIAAPRGSAASRGRDQLTKQEVTAPAAPAPVERPQQHPPPKPRRRVAQPAPPSPRRRHQRAAAGNQARAGRRDRHLRRHHRPRRRPAPRWEIRSDSSSCGPNRAREPRRNRAAPNCRRDRETSEKPTSSGEGTSAAFGAAPSRRPAPRCPAPELPRPIKRVPLPPSLPNRRAPRRKSCCPPMPR